MRRRFRFSLQAHLSALVFLGLAACGCAETHTNLAGMKGLVRLRFPDVTRISTGDLAAWLGDSRREPPLLLDVRTTAEYAVSHLHGAMRVEPGADTKDVLPLLIPGRAVVIYCSVGYRSSELAQRLQKAGVPRVFNLEGSIFQWANEGRPIEADGHPANKVHAYNAFYGKMLDEKWRAKP